MEKSQITVVMPTYNGARFLAAQLNSLLAQTCHPSRLIVSDDGSGDATVEIVERFARTAPFDVMLQRGPGRGVGANVLAALTHNDYPTSGFLALADQDDVWLPDKLARAQHMLAMCPRQYPVMYSAARQLVDARLRPLPTKHVTRGAAGFGNALVQNIAPANTMVLNGAAIRLAKQAALRTITPLPFHDWWIYQLIAGAGGRVVLDDAPVTLYRQHGDNLLGAGQAGAPRWARLNALFDGTYGAWMRAQALALCATKELLTPTHQAQLTRFLHLAPIQDCTLFLRADGFRRQRVSEQVLFGLAALFGRL